MSLYKNKAGEVFEVVQYIKGKPLPKGVFLKEVDEHKGMAGEKPEIVEKAFLKTKDPEGDWNVEGAFSSVADGMFILTHENGVVSICHPVVFAKEYEEVK